jgi:thiamine-phosphate pyrophosphorylase
LHSDTAAFPLLVAATDDERLARPDFDARLDALLAAGCPAVWLRSRALGDRDFLALARAVRDRCDEHGAELWVGERADVAALARADQVQLPERGLSVAGARRAAGAGVAVGRSVHSLEAAVAAAREGADRLVVGTIFASESHAGREVAGPALLRRVKAALAADSGGPPLFAIGGMTPERAPTALQAGADAVAAIRALWEAEDPGAAARAFLAALRRPPG